MLFASKSWLFAAAALVGGFFLALQYWAFAIAAFLEEPIAPNYGTSNVLLGLGFGISSAVFTVLYIGWAQKYYYFFKLQRRLDEYLANGRFEIDAPNGEHYSISGHRPFYTITATPHEGLTTYVYHISDVGSWAEACQSVTVIRADEALFSERELTEIRPILIDYRRTFKHLSQVFDVPTVVHN